MSSEVRHLISNFKFSGNPSNFLEQASPANHHASTWQLSLSGWFDSVFWLLDRLFFLPTRLFAAHLAF
jgi:hypothetical protein